MSNKARYTMNHRGAKKTKQSRASKKVVVRKTTQASYGDLIPGKRYTNPSVRLSDGNSRVDSYKCSQGQHGEHTWDCPWELVSSEGEDTQRESQRVSVVKDVEHLRTKIFDWFDDANYGFDAAFIASYLEATGQADKLVGLPTQDVKRMLDGKRETYWQMADNQIIASLEIMIEQGFDLAEEDNPSGSYWNTDTWGNVLDDTDAMPGSVVTSLAWLMQGNPASGSDHNRHKNVIRNYLVNHSWGTVPKQERIDALDMLWEMGSGTYAMVKGSRGAYKADHSQSVHRCEPYKARLIKGKRYNGESVKYRETVPCQLCARREVAS